MEQQNVSIIKCYWWKTAPYGSKGVLRHRNYRSDPKLGSCIVEIRRIPYSFHTCTIILSLSWDYTIKEKFNHTRYGRLYNCKYYLVIGSHNNWIIMNFR